MPTAAEFKRYGQKFESLKGNINGVIGFLGRDWSAAVRGGNLEHTVTESLDASSRMTTAISKGFDELKDLCNERQAQCDTWDKRCDEAKKAWESKMEDWKRDAEK